MRMGAATRFDAVYRFTFDINGWGFFGEKEIKMLVDYNVFPEEKQTLIDPGYPAFTEINSAKFVDAITNEEIELPDWIKDSVLNSNGFKEWLLSDASEQYEMMCDEAADNAREDY